MSISPAQHIVTPRGSPVPGKSTPPYPALLAYGFRPFFLLAGIYAAVAVPLWMVMLFGLATAQPFLPPLVWHAHEMLFGFMTAAVAGFLLTAVPNWTGRRGYAGAPLAGLVALWLSGRIVMSVALGLPGWICAVIDLAFLPMLAATILPALLRSGNHRNLVFIGLLALLFAANLHFHVRGGNDTAPLLLGLNSMLVMLALLGGRVVPAFTAAALKQRGIEVSARGHPVLDLAALVAVGSVLLVDLANPASSLAGVAAIVAALLLTVQLCCWHGHRTLRDPIVWILHLGFAWLPLCLALKAAWIFGAALPDSTWVHALTMGAIASMILGIMSRASLGHTGRELVVSRPVVFAYGLIAAAAISRVFGPLVLPGMTVYWPLVAAALWSLGFTLFVVVYAPILCRPRIDGRPG